MPLDSRPAGPSAESTRRVHRFRNGVRVYDDHLIPAQRERYAAQNVHEAEEEEIFLDLIRQLPPHSIFLNIGAAIGYYPILAKRNAPQLEIHAFEPHPKHVEMFLENIALNGFSPNDFHLHRLGISSNPGRALLNDRGYGSSLQSPGTPASKSSAERGNPVRRLLRALRSTVRSQRTETIPVESTTLDEFCETLTQPIRLCQMDIQGLELEALRGARKALKDHRVSTFLIGTHGENMHRGCADFLARFGYAVDIDLPDTTEQPDGILVASYSNGGAPG